MSDLLSPLAATSELLASLLRQGRAAQRFVLLEREAGALLSRLREPLDPSLAGDDGLLSETSLDPLFADPLPDSTLAAALASSAETAASASIEQTPAPVKRDRKADTGTTDSESAQVETPGPRKKLPPKYPPVADEATISREASVEQKPAAARKPQGVALGNKIGQRVALLQDKKKPPKARTDPRSDDASAQIADRETKPAGKTKQTARIADKPAMRAKKRASGKKPTEAPPKPVIDRRQAAQIMQQKWRHRGWNSPVKVGAGSAQAPMSGEETRQRPAEQRKTSRLASEQQDSEQRATEKRLEEKLARLRKTDFIAEKRSDSVDTAFLDAPRKSKKARPVSGQAPRQQAPIDRGGAQVETGAFAADPSAAGSGKLVGLRGLAARAAATESTATAAIAQRENRTGQASLQPGDSEAATAQVPTAAAGGAAARTTSASELAELIAGEARRAGINLDQFEP